VRLALEDNHLNWCDATLDMSCGVIIVRERMRCLAGDEKHVTDLGNSMFCNVQGDCIDVGGYGDGDVKHHARFSPLHGVCDDVASLMGRSIGARTAAEECG
jgi:hypothetical protein